MILHEFTTITKDHRIFNEYFDYNLYNIYSKHDDYFLIIITLIGLYTLFMIVPLIILMVRKNFNFFSVRASILSFIPLIALIGSMLYLEDYTGKIEHELVISEISQVKNSAQEFLDNNNIDAEIACDTDNYSIFCNGTQLEPIEHNHNGEALTLTPFLNVDRGVLTIKIST